MTDCHSSIVKMTGWNIFVVTVSACHTGAWTLQASADELNRAVWEVESTEPGTLAAVARYQALRRLSLPLIDE